MGWLWRPHHLIHQSGISVMGGGATAHVLRNEIIFISWLFLLIALGIFQGVFPVCARCGSKWHHQRTAVSEASLAAEQDGDMIDAVYRSALPTVCEGGGILCQYFVCFSLWYSWGAPGTANMNLSSVPWTQTQCPDDLHPLRREHQAIGWWCH